MQDVRSVERPAASALRGTWEGTGIFVEQIRHLMQQLYHAATAINIVPRCEDITQSSERKIYISQIIICIWSLVRPFDAHNATSRVT